MKLLNCTACHDIVALTNSVRHCSCQKSSGKYRDDKIVAVISGEYARVLGIVNNEYLNSLSVDIVPFATYYTWFPILTDERHHVIKVDNSHDC